jgi:hypothetical protein
VYGDYVFNERPINLNSRIHLTCHSEERSDEESPLSKGNLLQNGDSSLPLVAQNDMKRELSSAISVNLRVPKKCLVVNLWQFKTGS